MLDGRTGTPKTRLWNFLRTAARLMLAVVPSGCRIKGKCRLRWRRASRLWFAGQRYDAASGLHYNMMRDYEPATGRYSQSDPIGLGGGISTYGYVGGNPLTRIDPFGLQQATSGYVRNNGYGGERGSFGGAIINDFISDIQSLVNRIPKPRAPDYVHVPVGIYVATGGLTLTKNGTLFAGYGVAHGTPSSLVSGKFGFSAAAGYMQGCPKTGDEVDNFVTGATTGGSAYYVLGGGYGKNAAGSAVEVGVGTPGVALQPFEYMIPIWNTGLRW
jgi:RHS repeat-associated protein